MADLPEPVAPGSHLSSSTSESASYQREHERPRELPAMSMSEPELELRAPARALIGSMLAASRARSCSRWKLNAHARVHALAAGEITSPIPTGLSVGFVLPTDQVTTHSRSTVVFFATLVAVMLGSASVAVAQRLPPLLGLKVRIEIDSGAPTSGLVVHQTRDSLWVPVEGEGVGEE